MVSVTKVQGIFGPEIILEPLVYGPHKIILSKVGKKHVKTVEKTICQLKVSSVNKKKTI